MVAVDRTVVKLFLDAGDLLLKERDHRLLGLRVEIQVLVTRCDVRVVKLKHGFDSQVVLRLSGGGQVFQLAELALLRGDLASLDESLFFAGSHLEKAENFALTLDLHDDLIGYALIYDALLEVGELVDSGLVPHVG